MDSIWGGKKHEKGLTFFGKLYWAFVSFDSFYFDLVVGKVEDEPQKLHGTSSKKKKNEWTNGESSADVTEDVLVAVPQTFQKLTTKVDGTFENGAGWFLPACWFVQSGFCRSIGLLALLSSIPSSAEVCGASRCGQGELGGHAPCWPEHQ